jgi:hypothetical protein
MFTVTQSLTIAHQIQADRRTKAERSRRTRRGRRAAAELEAAWSAPMPGNVVLLREQVPVARRVA